MLLRSILLFLALTLLTFIQGQAVAAALSTRQQEQAKAKQALSQLKKDIEKLQKNLLSKRKQQSKAQSSLKDAEKQIATATKILSSTIRQLNDKEAELVSLRKQQKNLEQNKIRQKQALAAQVKSAYISGRQEYLKMLLNQEDPEALGRMLVYYDYMNRARSEKVQLLQQTLRDLDNIDVAIQSEIKELSLLKETRRAETDRLLKLKDKRKALVEQLSKEIETNSEQLTELEVNAAELQELIESVQVAIDKMDVGQPLTGLSGLKGKISPPARGRVSLRYGSSIAQGLSSNGVVIAANEGSSVNAIHFGRVVYADWLRGFGLLLILDHGEGYMTLYGYNQALYKEVGDWVEAGESIATVGQSGGQKQPGLYFEMRHQGKTFNPQHWFR